jgi:hypothetical protein
LATPVRRTNVFNVFKAANVTPGIAASLARDPAMIVIDTLRQLGVPRIRPGDW